jgi:hypothetical protein
MCNRSRWLVIVLAVFCLTMLIVRPGLAGPVVTTIPGRFQTINPSEGLKELNFTFLNGVTESGGVAGIEGHSWQFVNFALGEGTSTSGVVKITDSTGLPMVNIGGLAVWDIIGDGVIEITSPNSATATANLQLQQGTENPAFDWAAMQTAILVYEITDVTIGPLSPQLAATWQKGAPTATFNIIGVPEPGSFVLACSGAMLLAGIRLQMRQRTA